MKTRLFLTTALSLALLTMGGCSTVINTTTTKPLQDNLGKRTWGAKIDDSLIESKLAININKADPRLNNDSRVVVVSYNGVVLLAGEVPDANLKNIASQAVTRSKIRGIKQVHNDLQVIANIGVTVRSNDAWITSKIKSSMAFNGNVPASRIKVVTENGIVYLLGLVTHKEAQAAVTVVQNTSGVQRIVKLFEYID